MTSTFRQILEQVHWIQFIYLAPIYKKRHFKGPVWSCRQIHTQHTHPCNNKALTMKHCLPAWQPSGWRKGIQHDPVQLTGSLREQIRHTKTKKVENLWSWPCLILTLRTLKVGQFQLKTSVFSVFSSQWCLSDVIYRDWRTAFPFILFLWYVMYADYQETKNPKVTKCWFCHTSH